MKVVLKDFSTGNITIRTCQPEVGLNYVNGLSAPCYDEAGELFYKDPQRPERNRFRVIAECKNLNYANKVKDALIKARNTLE